MSPPPSGYFIAPTTDPSQMLSVLAAHAFHHFMRAGLSQPIESKDEFESVAQTVLAPMLMAANQAELCQLGVAVSTQTIVERIDQNLSHWHHHVRGWSIETLQRLDSPTATRLALNYLMAARRDPAHKSGDIDQTAKVMQKAS